MTLLIITAAIIIISIISYFIVVSIEKRTNRRISFKESMDLVELPVITFYNKDKKLNFLLDTGSNISYINNSILKDISIEDTSKEIKVIGIEGNPINTKICKIVITYKDITFTEEFSIANLNDAFDIVKQESGVQIHGILGSKFFEKYKYIIDFKTLAAYTK